jgi:RNA-directed DNA polymerase
MIGRSSNTSELWKNLPWKKFRRNLFRLQCLVFKAVINLAMKENAGAEG